MIIMQRILPNAMLGDDFGVWESSIIYEVLYFILEAKKIIGFMARLLMEMAIFIELPHRRHRIRHRCGSKDLMNPLEVGSYMLAQGSFLSQKIQRTFFVKLG